MWWPDLGWVRLGGTGLLQLIWVLLLHIAADTLGDQTLAQAREKRGLVCSEAFERDPLLMILCCRDWFKRPRL